MTCLPVSVIIPTLNCREKLERHLEASKEWLSLVGEIIAIDSESNDGTFEFLEEQLLPYRAEIISTGPGLYRAWNLGIKKAKYPYIYFSTIGDIISLNGLEYLVNQVGKNQLDLIITPPAVVNKNNQILRDVHWPSHFVIGDSPKQEEIIIPDKNHKYLLASIFIPESILGSSASNIYRADILKKFPFPENYGTQGDVVWGIQNLPNVAFGISSRKVATFCWDGDRVKTWDHIINTTEALKSKVLDTACKLEINACDRLITNILFFKKIELLKINRKSLLIRNKYVYKVRRSLIYRVKNYKSELKWWYNHLTKKFRSSNFVS